MIDHAASDDAQRGTATGGTGRDRGSSAVGPSGPQRLGPNIVFRNLVFVTVMSAVLGVLLAAPVSAIPALGTVGTVFVGVGVASMFATFLILYLGIRFQPVWFDLDAGTARLRGRTVPIDSVNRAFRRHSAAASSGYVELFIRSEEFNAQARLLVGGGPMRHFRPDDYVTLERFVERTAIAVPESAGGPSPAQQEIAGQFAGDRKHVALSREQLLAELRGEGQEQFVADRTEVTDEEGTELELQMAEDALSADHALEGVATVSAAVKRVGTVIIAISIVGVIAALVSLLLGESGMLRFSRSTENVIAAVMGFAFLIGFGGYLLFCLASYPNIRARQRVALDWLASRGAAQRTRGLPPVLLRAFTGPPPANRIRYVLAFTLITLGLLGVLGGPAILATTDFGLSIGLVPLLLGVAASVVGWTLFGLSRRATRRQRERAVELGGYWLIPPIVHEAPPE